MPRNSSPANGKHPNQTIPLEHGGRLLEAAAQYGIAAAEWLDLSTGINPNGWPVPPPPPSCWLRLPEEQDRLIVAAAQYYNVKPKNLLAVAGSQAAIQALPTLRPASQVAVLHPAYAEHEFAWRRQGHNVTIVTAEQLQQRFHEFDVVVLINPNNPTGQRFSIPQLTGWQKELAARGGWLVVDEAFMDPTPEQSLIQYRNEPATIKPGLIVLRSIGKFFGLAGARVGFVAAEASLLQDLQQELGPWAVSGPSRWAATEALLDATWQASTRKELTEQGQRLHQLLTDNDLPPSGGCSLFQWVKTDAAAKVHKVLAKQGVLVRYFSDPSSLRFGLPTTEADWQRLQAALQNTAVTAA